MKTFSASLILLAAFLCPAATARADPVAKTHWSFVPPSRPTPPAVKDAKRIRNPIDAFILARLEKQHIRPSPEADRKTLIRRLSFDLLGLPPKPEEVRAFVHDSDPDAFEHLVERLLASPHFGEQWGRHWLDVARYADSDGYEKDGTRPFAYLYRDWVMEALNRDLPFDQFTLEQLAGDLLPAPTTRQKIATGFHRQTLTNKEGGIDKEEFRCKAVVDRTSTTAAVWLGLTLGCAECHSHKYDPISQREFYQFYAFFNNASETEFSYETAAQTAARLAWEQEQVKKQERLDAHLKKDFSVAQAKWENKLERSLAQWRWLAPAKLDSSDDATTLTNQPDLSILARGEVPETDSYSIDVQTNLTGVTAFRLEAMADPSPEAGPGRAKNGNFVLTTFSVKLVTPDGQSRSIALTNAAADFAQKDFPPSAALDDDATSGWAVSPQLNRSHVAVFETAADLEIPPGARLVFTLDHRYGKENTLRHFRLSATSGPRPVKPSLLPDAVAMALAAAVDQRDENQRARLARYYREEVDPETRKLEKDLAAHKQAVPAANHASVLKEEVRPRDTRIHVRGDFLRKGDAVGPGTLAVLHPLQARPKPDGALPDRLDLASWLIAPANPLTTRVTVNRIWSHLFGRGLTTSLDDFGTRGERPGHLDLLDWLATEFPRRGWSQKEMIKLIVTSATYRQSSRPRDDLAAVDPENVLLARQNRFRLGAENVRDAYLAASELLNPAIGGPSVRPPLPADIAAVGYANSIQWRESQGAERYRRGLYIFFQRTVPYPMLTTFDAPDSNVSCTRRERSNTPLQALTLLNDPVFFECARALGKRMATETAPSPKEKIKRAFERCLSRPPSPAELNRLQRFYDEQRRLTSAQLVNAGKIVGDAGVKMDSVVETATFVAVARTLLNLDEFVTRD